MLAIWTYASRGRMGEIDKLTKSYPTDLTDAAWVQIEPLLPGAAATGLRTRVNLRETLNAIRYMTRIWSGWRMLQRDFPPRQTAYWWFRRFVRLLLLRTIHDVTLMLDRERCRREASVTDGCARFTMCAAPKRGAFSTPIRGPVWMPIDISDYQGLRSDAFRLPFWAQSARDHPALCASRRRSAPCRGGCGGRDNCGAHVRRAGCSYSPPQSLILAELARLGLGRRSSFQLGVAQGEVSG
jgi:transposase